MNINQGAVKNKPVKLESFFIRSGISKWLSDQIQSVKPQNSQIPKKLLNKGSSS